MRSLLVIFMLFLAQWSMSQSHNDWWYFGNFAGVHFTPAGPVPDTNGALFTLEGCAAVSSEEGDLLFYTNGIDVFDAQHNVMPNGDSLYGNGSSTQSSVIVPYPGFPDKYCIFTVSGCTGVSIGFPPTERASQLFAYTVVDMSLNGGLGDVDVSQKNIVLFDSAAEKITVAPHANGSDLWLIGVVQDTFLFYAYRLGYQGIVDTVVSNIPIPPVFNCTGYMLANHKGDRFAMSSGGGLRLFGFNQSTGVIDPNPDLISSNSSYGFHFSPNDSLFYAMDFSGGLNQFDLTASNIEASAIEVASLPAFGGFAAAFSEGPDEKIYIARTDQQYLSSIEDPNVPGIACNVLDTAVQLAGRTCFLGLPNSVASSVFGVLPFQYRRSCVGDTSFFAFDSTTVDSVFWNFGDPTSGSNTSSLFDPTHVFTDTGNYTIEVIYYRGALVDTVIEEIFIYPHQSLELGLDTSLCEPEVLLLDVAQDFSTYLWQDGSTADTFLVTNSGQISVTLFGVCDTLMDTINVIVDSLASVDLPNDTLLCDGKELAIQATISGSGVLQWNITGAQGNMVTVTSSGVYALSLTNGCGIFADSMEVQLQPNVDLTLLPNDTVQCFSDPVLVSRPLNDTIDFYWQDSSTVEVFQVDSSMVLTLTAVNDCGLIKDTMRVTFNEVITTELGEDTSICNKDSIKIFGTDTSASYFWNTGDTSDTIWSIPDQDENYVVTVTLGECQKVESKRVTVTEVSCPNINCQLEYGNYFSPNGDGINDRFVVWSDCDVYKFDMSVYNRWGQLMNYTQNIAYGWDGYVNGEPASEGVYYFVVEYKDWVVVDADLQITRGSFTLLR